MHGSHWATSPRGSALSVQSLLIFLLVGAIAGWLAGLVVKGRGLGLVGNIVIGILGAFIAGWLLPQLGIYIGGGIVGAILNAMIGAIILLVVVMAVRRA
ncbi:Uncharacterized membrane protein YeaQ/YmgE, transglycosylase-associated protein family [Dokdonella immobilis]|uniref:Uncharacterized membrane protein YeaQ/YmgE, transglycosylase-associated protein family n=1 Tax=Dokdonella immobilis TaxID=578942 RepID=A0A1I4YKX0_9GAMM|nr:GlsB/YeaQ/YmgE family stress response membrane protein [Dokdonella immobilis]SFN38666.1 Uncharacterized membrane protein YeaQ/YmgE, transglycosylase-associated protein family [Dokdonella immobilis]